MEMMEYMGAGMLMAYVAPFITLFLALPVIIYIVARWRHEKEGQGADSQLGMKVAMSVFKVVGFQVALLGTFLILYGAIAKGGKEEIMRLAAGVLLPGLVVYGAHALAMARSNDPQYPLAGRMFAGWNIVQTGLAGTIGLIFACVVTFSEGVPSEIRKVAWTHAVVYMSAWGLLLLLYIRKYVPGYPTPSMPSAPPASSGGAGGGYGGGYPPQGGGYPPQGGGYPPQGGGYPPQGGGYPPQGGGYPPQGGGGGYGGGYG